MNKKYIRTIPCVIVTLICTMFFFSCGNEAEPASSKSTGNLELDKFFKSKTYTEFSTNFNVDVASFQLDKMEVTPFKTKGLNLFSIPVVKNGVKLGQISICSKNEGTSFKVLYEDMEKLDLKSGGDIQIFTSDKVFIANIEVVKTENVFYTRISKVGLKTSMRIKSSATEEGETFNQCVTRVYKTAATACTDSPSCWIPCLAADIINGSCTMAMIAASEVACAVYG